MTAHPQSAPPASTHEEGGLDLSLVGLLTILVRQWKVLVVLPLVSAVTAGVIALLFPSFTAEARFTPNESGSSLSRLAGLASQFGFALPTDDNTASVDFYGQLLGSRDLLTQAVRASYRFQADPDFPDSLRGDYIQLYGIEEDTPAKTLLAAIDHLNDRLSIQKDAASGIVTIRVTARWPRLAELVAKHLIEEAGGFNAEKRQSGASAEREFIEGRLAGAKQELEQEEAAQLHFLQDNRTYSESPRLKFEADRLQSRVDLRRQVYTTLAQAHEQARIEEVRNTPVLTVVDQPEGSSRPDRSPVISAIFGLVVGGILALGILFTREFLRQEEGRHPGEFAELQRLSSGAVAGLRRLRARLSGKHRSG